MVGARISRSIGMVGAYDEQRLMNCCTNHESEPLKRNDLRACFPALDLEHMMSKDGAMAGAIMNGAYEAV